MTAIPGEVAARSLDAAARAARTSLAALAAGEEGKAQHAAERAAEHARRAAEHVAAWRAALTIAETAALAEVDPEEVRAAIVTGRLAVLAVGPHRRIVAEDAAAYADAQQRRPRNAETRRRPRKRAGAVGQ